VRTSPEAARERPIAARFAIALAWAVLAASGCTTTVPSVRFASVAADDVDDMDTASLALAADRTAEALERTTGDRHHQVGAFEIPNRELARSARRIAELAREAGSPAELTRALGRACRAWPAREPAKVTGYYEPLLDARTRPDAKFRYPIYSAPSRAQLAALHEKLGRTPTRADIDRGNALTGLGLELAWLDDPVARFFLHVQGSGKLRFEDGSERRVGFSASNDLAYVSVGSIMLEQGQLERGAASATAMKRWLAGHPDERDALLERNPRYVFFRDNAAEGPTGSLGVALVAGRSIAADPSHVPPGMMTWLRTMKPVVDDQGAMVGQKRMTRFAFTQDTGAAIQGPARVDLFFGSGEAAGFEAGAMNQSGELYLLLCSPRPPGGPITGPYGAPYGRSRGL
jgi:membrane-bound lytic murein transglycosylase A